MHRKVWSVAVLIMLLLVGCASPGNDAEPASTADSFDMVAELRRIAADADPLLNPWDNERRLATYSAYAIPTDPVEKIQLQGTVALEFLLSGRAQLAVQAFERILESVEAAPQLGPVDYATTLRQLLGLSNLRLGEQENCIDNHLAKACIVPFDPSAIHRITNGSRNALAIFSDLERTGGATSATRYLLNVAAMTLGIHPDSVDAPYRLTYEQMFGSLETTDFAPFSDIAEHVGLDVMGLSGGGIVEDFDGDGDLDVLVSSWGLVDQIRYLENDGTTGTVRFVDRTTEANLDGITGGLNMKHADYDNDGDFDVLVLRGAWLGNEGRHPNSLLKNQGDGTFVDVTSRAGLLSYHPTQTAEWNDFDGDGWLDVFIGNESTADAPHPCQLFRNNGDGTFTDVAADVGLDIRGFVKGVTSGDVDGDGDPDLYVSLLGRPNRLFENTRDGFIDITSAAGVSEPINGFPAWFFDYNQDGRLDLLALSYAGDVDDIVAALLGEGDQPETMRLYRNDGDKTFTDVTAAAGLSHAVKTMGSNFGDLDNDGFPDFYLGTGDPDFRTLIPNRMFQNVEGRFRDVTTSGRFGHLQKGHGVSFADVDNDGDQDVHIVIGGAFSGDRYRNALFENPNADENSSIQIQLAGSTANRAGVGARVRAVITTNGHRRSVYGTVGTGGSFGANPHRLSLGTGQATTVDTLEVVWPWNAGRQVFTALPAQRRYTITQGADELVSERFSR